MARLKIIEISRFQDDACLAPSNLTTAYMTMPRDLCTEFRSWTNSSRRGLYMLLLALQTIGVGLFYFK